MPKPAVEAALRFWSKVQKSDGCWLWTAGTNPHGYGVFMVSKTPRLQMSAHRFSWWLANGPIAFGLCVLHRCDVPACVNPDHLFLGTQADNMRDCAVKGRHKTNGHKFPSELHWKAKLDWDAVRRIRQRHAAGERYALLAKEFGVGSSTVYGIVTGKNWVEK